MSRFLLALLMILTLTMTFGCAMKSAKSPTTDPALQQQTSTTTMDDSLRGDQGQIREETIFAAPQTTMRTEPLSSLETPVLAGLQVVPFSYDQHLLSDEARNIIAANAAILKKAGNLRFRLAGHCDERGSDQYNIALGERRAESVRAYLLELGIDAGRMETVSYGEEQPLDTGSGESAWMKNRRVEFILLP
ncbi:MAG: peptidoglycan-associated lipoprotein [Deltaproteobacteria bacterium HGW-Deltaproteobacteria-4]|nr:MAG: peptidoglycan-associated lipoprotein [Deltaproteobacteria bacterium HGW-Deltaproteobacteria-4]